jgi:putative endonuclease
MTHWFVYMLQSTVTQKLYTGITTDLGRRLHEHNTSKKGAKSTRAGRPWIMVYCTRVASKSAALRREIEIKKLPRVRKLRLADPSEPSNLVNLIPQD